MDASVELDSSGAATLRALARRPLPSFEQWLNDNGNGQRGDGFEAFHDLARRTHDSAEAGLQHLTPAERSFLRMWCGMQLAIIELANIEHQNKIEPALVITMLPRVLATAAVYSVASVVNNDTPMRQMAKILIEEFRFAAKEAADQIEASR